MRRPAAKKPREGADQPNYRSERDPAAPDLRNTSRRGSGAPRRLSRRTGKAERGSEEARPAPTTGPRRRAREPAPRRAPPAASVQMTCGPGASPWQERPRRRRRDSRRSCVWIHAPADYTDHSAGDIAA